MRFCHSTRTWGPALACLAAMVISGCGGDTTYTYEGPTGQLSGEITFKGQPVTEGQVVLISLQGSAVGDIETDGKFAMAYMGSADLPVGNYKVFVKPPSTGAATTGDEDAPLTVDHPQIPKQYQLASTSKETVAVKEGENPPLKIDMK